MCFRSVFIISVKKAFDWGERPASQSEDLCRTKRSLSDKGTPLCCLATTKIRAGKIFEKSLPNLRYGFRGRVCSRYNITTVRAPKQTLGADWSGLGRTSEPKRFTLLYIAAGIKESVCEPRNRIILKGYRVGAMAIVPGRNSLLKSLFLFFGRKDMHKL